MDIGKILRFSMDAGELMLKSGGETNRVEDTMLRILNKYNFKEVNVFVTPTGIFASVIDSLDKSHTHVKRILERSTNLEKISLTNSLSRQFVESKMSLDEAFTELSLIREKPPYPLSYKCLAAAVSCSCFSFMFGGGLSDSIAAFLAGITVYYCSSKLSRGKLSGSISTIINGMLAAISVLILHELGIGLSTDKAIIGTVMLLVPGVGITNAVRDVMVGDYISGTSRIVDALIIAVCIAVGVGVGHNLFAVMKGVF